jgi:hypothetical protein
MPKRTDPDVERVWREFWADIVAPGGQLDLEQVKRELYDFSHLLDNVPKVYMAVTGGMVSKPNTDASAVIGEFEESDNRRCEEAVADEASAALD